MAINPTSSLPEKFTGNILILMFLIFSLAGIRFWLEKEAGAVPYPYWLAVSDDAIAVLYGDSIYVSDTKGTIVRTIHIPDYILPCQLSWHNNDLLVSDWRNHAVHLFSASGISSIPLQGGPQIDAHLNAVIDERHNTIYVTDSGGNRIHTYDSEGRYIRSFGTFGLGRGALSSPKDIRFRDNLLYVGNVMRSGVDVFSTDGTFIKSVVEPKGNRLDNLITDFDVAEDRIATIECNVLFEHCRIAVYDGTGMLLNTIPHPAGPVSVGDIALRKSIVYVSDTVNRKVTRYYVGTLDNLGPASTDLNALGTSYNSRYNALKNASRITVIALILCFIPLALLYRHYKRSRKDEHFVDRSSNKNELKGAYTGRNMTKIIIQRDKDWRDKLRAYNVYVDGKAVGNLRQDSKLEFDLTPGNHNIQLKIDWCKSNVLSITATDGQIAMLECGNNVKKPLMALLYISIWRGKYLWLREKR